MTTETSDAPKLPISHPDLPFRLHVCGKNQVKKAAKRIGATHVITLLDPMDRLFLPPSIDPRNHFRLSFDDEEKSTKLYAPTPSHVETILAYGRNIPTDAIVIVHCHAGQCRSTAAALAILVQSLGTDRVDEAVALLVANRPEAVPNRLMAFYADRLLGTGSKLLDASKALRDARYMPGGTANPVFEPPM